MINKRTTASFCLCGDGWGAIAALDGLALCYTDVVVVTNDEEVIECALIKGFRVASDLMLVDANLYLCAGLTQIIKKEFLDNKEFSPIIKASLGSGSGAEKSEKGGNFSGAGKEIDVLTASPKDLVKAISQRAK